MKGYKLLICLWLELSPRRGGKVERLCFFVFVFFRMPRSSKNETLWFRSLRITFSDEEEEENNGIFAFDFHCFQAPSCISYQASLLQGVVKYAMRSSHFHLFTSPKKKCLRLKQTKRNKYTQTTTSLFSKKTRVDWSKIRTIFFTIQIIVNYKWLAGHHQLVFKFFSC